MSRDRFARFVAKGENPNGFTAVTPNGISHARADGLNHQCDFEPNINGPRWTMPPAPGCDGFGGYEWGGPKEGQTASSRTTGNRNRSGE